MAALRGSALVARAFLIAWRLRALLMAVRRPYTVPDSSTLSACRARSLPQALNEVGSWLLIEEVFFVRGQPFFHRTKLARYRNSVASTT